MFLVGVEVVELFGLEVVARFGGAGEALELAAFSFVFLNARMQGGRSTVPPATPKKPLR